jgi:hypothetical protein
MGSSDGLMGLDDGVQGLRLLDGLVRQKK